MKMKRNGSVTVFLALVFVCISALVLALVESARTAGTRYYLQNMANSGIDSLFSEYNRALWDSYRLILLESRDDEKTRQQLEQFMKPYAENCGWYTITAPKAEITESDPVTGGGGVWFEQEVCDYMKFGWISGDHTPDSATALWKQINEANAMNDITEAYGLRSKEAVKMEKAVKKIIQNLKDQKDLKSKAHSQLLSGSNSSFQRTADKLKSKAEALPGLIQDYDKKADAFGTHLAAVRTEHATDFEKLEPENREALEEQIRSYEEYTDQDGVRRKEIDGLDDNVQNTVANITSVKELADETQDYIDEADDEDDIDEDDLWRKVADSWDLIAIPQFNGSCGVEDEEKEDQLESISDFVGDGFLKLVLPSGRTVSDTKIDTSLFPSVTSITPRTGDDPSLLTRLAVDEYAGKFLPHFVDDSKRPIACQLEYVVSGKTSDEDNMKDTLLQVLAIRTGLNFLHIMRNSEMRGEARTLAVTIAGSVALPALAGLIECLIITAWSLSESLMDIHALLEGKRIGLIKGKNDWMLELPQVLTIAATGKLPENSIKESRYGIAYESYLKLLLFIKSAEERDYRTMDMIQANMRLIESGFLMKNCIYGMKSSVSCESRHLFTSLGISAGNQFSLSPVFSVSAETVKAY